MKTELKLSELAHGAVQEKFEREMVKVLANIGDPNTEPTKPREVNIKLKITPDEYREFSDVVCTVSSKLVPDSDLGMKFIIGRDLESNFVATEYKKQIPGQLIMEEPVDVVEKETKNMAKVATLYK